jgi:hypothetical protein
MKFSTKLLNSDIDIISSINKSLLPDIRRYFKNIASKLEPQIQNIVKNGITNSPEYQSLISGRLKYEFGLSDPENRLSQILNIWERIEVSDQPAKIVGNQIYAKLEILMIQQDYSDVLNIPASTLITKKGEQLRWLEWLLLLGDKTIIKEYEVVLGGNKNSRTGNAVMKKKTSGKWKVPSTFSGTATSNWITRVLDSVDGEINSAINKVVKL